MSYENAAATKLVATHCAVCSRPLVDAVSVETGIGPECRRKHGFDIEVSEAIRAQANASVYAIAMLQAGDGVDTHVNTLLSLGFEKLANRISERLCSVYITVEDGFYAVLTPYNEAAVAGFREIPGRRWDGQRKLNLVPAAGKDSLLSLLRRYFGGARAMGPKGVFRV